MDNELQVLEGNKVTIEAFSKTEVGKIFLDATKAISDIQERLAEIPQADVKNVQQLAGLLKIIDGRLQGMENTLRQFGERIIKLEQHGQN